MNDLNSFYLLTGLFMVVSTVMILVILMQRPKGGGLSAARKDVRGILTVLSTAIVQNRDASGCG